MDASQLYATYLELCAGEPPQRTAAELETAAAALDLYPRPATWETFWGKLDPDWFWGKQNDQPFHSEPQANAVYRSLALHRGLVDDHERVAHG